MYSIQIVLIQINHGGSTKTKLLKRKTKSHFTRDSKGLLNFLTFNLKADYKAASQIGLFLNIGPSSREQDIKSS